jgi:signal transduction histidine kinase
MRERAEAIKATLHIESQIGQGTQMTLVWMKQRELTDERY